MKLGIDAMAQSLEVSRNALVAALAHHGWTELERLDPADVDRIEVSTQTALRALMIRTAANVRRRRPPAP